jgi:hypothetical protein
MRGRSVVLLVAALAFLLFAALRSRDYTSVDGAVRCVEVFHRQAPFVHENNHLLYPVNVFLWHRLLAGIGLRAATPLEFFPLSQLMNAAAAAVTLAAFAGLVWLVTASRWAALLGAALLGLSRAFLLHATNSAEPMVGLMWSCLAILLLALALRRDSLALAAAAGALFAPAMASYQSMALAAPIGLALCLAWRRRPLHLLLAAIVGGVLGTGLVYGLAYGLTGTGTPEAMLRRFFSIGGAPETFGGLSLRKAAVLPLGLASNLLAVLPDDFSGFRFLLRHPAALLRVALAILGILALSVVVAARTRRAWPRLPAPAQLGIAAGLAGFCATVIAPAAWEPLYDKLWLQPIACLTFLLVVALASGAFPVRGKQAGLLLTAVLASNLVWAVADHRRATPSLREAEQVARQVAPQDLVVHDWDQISVLYATIWGRAPGWHTFDFPTRSVRSGPQVLEELHDEMRRTRARGGRIWFLGILDQPPGPWREFLGKKANVPFEALQTYRKDARIVARLPSGDAAITLRSWPP